MLSTRSFSLFRSALAAATDLSGYLYLINFWSWNLSLKSTVLPTTLTTCMVWSWLLATKEIMPNIAAKSAGTSKVIMTNDFFLTLVKYSRCIINNILFMAQAIWFTFSIKISFILGITSRSIFTRAFGIRYCNTSFEFVPVFNFILMVKLLSKPAISS